MRLLGIRVLAVLLAVWGTGPALGQGVLCKPDPVGSYTDAVDRLVRTQIVGDVLFGIVDDFGIRSVDISDPAFPDPLNWVHFDENPGGFVPVDDQTLCVWNYDNGLYLFDVTNPMDMRQGVLFRTFGVYDAVFRDGYGYVAEGWSLKVVRVHSVDEVEEVHRVSSNLREVALTQESLVVADLSDGISIYDLADPGQPTEVLHFLPDLDVRELAAAGDSLYVFSQDSYFQVYDLSNPQDPVLHDRVAMPGGMRLARVGDGFLYVGLDHGGVARYDISNPNRPVLDSWIETGGTGLLALGDGVVAEPLVSGGVDLYDTTAPWPAPPLWGSTPSAADISEVVLDDDLLVMGVEYQAFQEGVPLLQLASIAEPRSPEVVGEYALPEHRGPVYGLDVHAGHAYLAMRNDHSEVIDITDPTRPVKVGNIGEPNDRFEDFATRDGYLYGVGQVDSFVVFDLSDPATPVEVARTDPVSGWAYQVTVHENAAYVSWGSTLTVVDITDPESPVGLGSFWSGPITRTRVHEGLLYVLTSGDFSIYDLDDPLAPVLLGRDRISNTHDVFILGDTAFGTGPAGMTLVDVADPTNPEGVGFINPFGDYLTGAVYRDGLAYFSGTYAGELYVLGFEPCDRGCVADWNADGEVNSSDLIAFRNDWVLERDSSCDVNACATDLDANGVVDTRDFVAFLNAWSAGC